MKTYMLLVVLVVVVISACNVKNTDKNDPKPNIIIIYADDLGIGMLGHEGQEIVKTPHIDRLAEEGMRFTNAYSSMVCAASRATLITGKHDCHNPGFPITNAGIYKSISRGENTYEDIQKLLKNVLPPTSNDAVFLAQVAQESGYKTAQYGKLEYGFAVSHAQMERHGWDNYFGYLDHVRAHGFYPPFLFRNGELEEIEGNTKENCGKSIEPETTAAFNERWDMTGKNVYSQTLFMDSVLQYIEKNKHNPFLLYFPTQLPHGPVSIPEVHPDFIDDDRLTQIEKEYASMVKLLDDNVGQIMAKLKALNIDDNTLILFTADNGHEIYYSQKGRVVKPTTNMQTGERFDDYKHKYYSDLAGDVFDGNGGRAGIKRSNLQGGIRVPLLVRWPKGISPNSTCDKLVTSYDILPTVAEIAACSKEYATDGISLLTKFKQSPKSEEHDFVTFSSFIGPTLVANDGWKLRTVLKKDVFELYFLPDDFKETNDLADKYPEKLEELKSKLLEACDGDFKNGLFSWNGIKVK